MAKKKTAGSAAVKKLKSEAKKFIDEYKEKFLLLAVSFFESKAKNIITWVKDIGHLKRKFRGVAIFTALLIVGLFLVVFGIADYVTFKVPALANGWGKVVVGLVIVVIGYIIKKLS